MDRRASRNSTIRSNPLHIPTTTDKNAAKTNEIDLKAQFETISPISPISSAQDNNTLQELRFLVTGSQSCGKTSFIEKALDLKRPVISRSTCKKMSLDGQVFLINLIEVPIEDISIINGNIKWPGRVGNIQVTQVDGVLALYDVTRKESLSRIPPLLSKLRSQPLFSLRFNNRIQAQFETNVGKCLKGYMFNNYLDRCLQELITLCACQLQMRCSTQAKGIQSR